MMLGREDHRAEAARLRGTRPLPRIQVRRREDRRILAAVAPLAIGEGVDAEVQEERELVALPRELRGRRARARPLDPPGACPERSRRVGRQRRQSRAAPLR